MLYQLAANRGWQSWLADASSAFLQGEATEEERELYALPVPQLREALGLNEDDVVQILKECYGLTNAPRRWYEKVKKDLEGRGWYACKLEPCLFTKLDSQGNVIGLILVHVDDFQITGDYDNKEFRGRV